MLEYRALPSEQARTASLMQMVEGVSSASGTAMDIGARDGFFSVRLTEYFSRVIALDLTLPTIAHSQVANEQGNVLELQHPSNSIDLVFCAEVLEHIPSKQLTLACQELSRVSARHVLIGVPFNQDLRAGKTTCPSCGRTNPPWAHVNRFDADKIARLFPELQVIDVQYVGSTKECSNSISAWLLDRAGNPYGTYEQEERCIHCGGEISFTDRRTLAQKIMTKLAYLLISMQQRLVNPQPAFIHVLMEKKLQV